MTTFQVADNQDAGDVHRQVVVHANYEAFTLVLVAVQVVNGLLWLVLPTEQARVVVLIGLPIGPFLTIDALIRLRSAPDKRHFLLTNYGWLVILGSIPLPFIGVLRLAWYWLMIRRLRREDYVKMGLIVVEQRARNALLIALLAVILVLEIGGILILRAESGEATANIQSASDALWWILVTIATVGYGDTFPVTGSGRMIGVAVLVVGVGLFSVLSSFLAQWFIRAGPHRFQENEPADTHDNEPVEEKLDALTATIERNAATQQAELAELRAKLDEIERRLSK